MTEDERHVYRAFVGSETTLALGEVLLAMVGWVLLSRTLASALPAMESRVIPR